MAFAIVLNDFRRPGPRLTAYMVGWEAWRRGHDVWVTNVADISARPDGRVHARVASVERRRRDGRDVAQWVAALKAAPPRSIELDRARTVLLRNTPAAQRRHGVVAGNPGAELGRLLERHGVRVVNAPDGLARAASKTYLATLPAGTVPPTLLTTQQKEARAFAESLDGPVVLKPAVGYGGAGVFVVSPDDRRNLGAMFQTLRSRGLVCVQAFVPEAADGDTRVLIMGGAPVTATDSKGRRAVCAYRRVHADDDFRNNTHAGARPTRPRWTPRDEALCHAVGARLAEDGLDFVGLDIAGGVVLDVNVHNPGGLRLANEMNGVDFGPALLDALL